MVAPCEYLNEPSRSVGRGECVNWLLENSGPCTLLLVG